MGKKNVESILDVILERVFQFIDAEGNTGIISLQIGKPYKFPEPRTGLEWCCPFQLTDIGSSKIYNATGVDSIAALYVALRLAELFLISESKRFGLKITWENDVVLGLSFPTLEELMQQTGL